jgi:hypothetical protein
MLAETESPAAWFLHEQSMTRDDAVNFMPGVVRQSFSHRRRKPVVVEKVKRRRPSGHDG